MSELIDQYSEVSLYADDIVLYTIAETQVEIMLNPRTESLNIVNDWFKANWLTINADKSKYVIFGSKYKLTDKADVNLAILSISGLWLTSMK